MFPCPEPQKTEQCPIKVPTLSGVKVKVAGFPFATRRSILSSRMRSPCGTSPLARTSSTGSPFFTVISPGVKANRFAVTSIRRGLAYAAEEAHMQTASNPAPRIRAAEPVCLRSVVSKSERTLFNLLCCSRILMYTKTPLGMNSNYAYPIDLPNQPCHTCVSRLSRFCRLVRGADAKAFTDKDIPFTKGRLSTDTCQFARR